MARKKATDEVIAGAAEQEQAAISEEGERDPELGAVEYDVQSAPDFCGTGIEVVSVGDEDGEEREKPPAPPPEVASDDGDCEPTDNRAERRAFYDLNFRELDRDLSPEEQQEWNAIYASYRGRSVMSGQIAGTNPRVFHIRDRRTGEIKTHNIFCAVVIPYRVPILIPETELWFRGEERPRYVLKNMGDANIEFVITYVDREKDYVVASRRLALASRRYYFSNQPNLNRLGARVPCSVLTVSLRRLLVSCYGYDVNLTQRDLDYTAIPDLTKKYHRGESFDCLVKEYDSRANRLVLSAKELVPNPYDGAELRHPIGCSRQATISSKYAGGVFCNLRDGVTVMCNYSFHFEDGDFDMGDRVTVVIQRYEDRKKQVYGKIVAKG